MFRRRRQAVMAPILISSPDPWHRIVAEGPLVVPGIIGRTKYRSLPFPLFVDSTTPNLLKRRISSRYLRDPGGLGMASDFLDTKRRVGFYRRGQDFMFNLAPCSFKKSEILSPDFFRSRGEKILHIIIGYRVFNMSNTKIFYSLLHPFEGVIGGDQIELEAMGGIVILFLLYQNIQVKYGSLRHQKPPPFAPNFFFVKGNFSRGKSQLILPTSCF